MARIYTAGIIRRDDKFLCVFHRHLQCWLFAGGKLESGETAAECMIRELREELGIEVTDLEFFRGYLNERNGTEWVGLFYTIHQFSGEPRIMEDELGGVEWLTVEEMCERSASQPEMGIASYLRDVVSARTDMNKKNNAETGVVKNKSTPQGREFWNHVEAIAKQSRAAKSEQTKVPEIPEDWRDDYYLALASLCHFDDPWPRKFTDAVKRIAVLTAENAQAQSTAVEYEHRARDADRLEIENAQLKAKLEQMQKPGEC